MISCGIVVPFRETLDQVFLGVFDAFADCVRNLAGLAQAETDGAVAVANNNQSCKLEDTTAFYRFGNTVNGNNSSLADPE